MLGTALCCCGTRRHDLAAHIASEPCWWTCPRTQRGRGMPGARRPHAPPAKKMLAAGTTGSAETSRHSPRGWLERLLRVLPGAPGFLATVCDNALTRLAQGISV